MLCGFPIYSLIFFILIFCFYVIVFIYFVLKIKDINNLKIEKPDVPEWFEKKCRCGHIHCENTLCKKFIENKIVGKKKKKVRCQNWEATETEILNDILIPYKYVEESIYAEIFCECKGSFYEIKHNKTKGYKINIKYCCYLQLICLIIIIITTSIGWVTTSYLLFECNNIILILTQILFLPIGLSLFICFPCMNIFLFLMIK